MGEKRKKKRKRKRKFFSFRIDVLRMISVNEMLTLTYDMILQYSIPSLSSTDSLRSVVLDETAHIHDTVMLFYILYSEK